MGLFQKKFKQGVEDMEFPGVLNRMWKFLGSIQKKRSGNLWGNPEEIMWNFYESWLLALEIPMGVL